METPRPLTVPAVRGGIRQAEHKRLGLSKRRPYGPPQLSPVMEQQVMERVAARDDWMTIARDLGVSYNNLHHFLRRRGITRGTKIEEVRTHYEDVAPPVMFDAIRLLAHRIVTKPSSVSNRDLNMFIGTTHDKLFGVAQPEAPDAMRQLLESRRWEVQELAVRLVKKLPPTEALKEVGEP